MVERLLDWVEKHHLESTVAVTLGLAALLMIFPYVLARGVIPNAN